MTNQEAIELLQTPIHCADKGDEEDMREALSMAIKALENHDTFMKYSYEQGKKDALSQEPCRVKNELNVELNVELKPCTDAVSREAVNTLVDELARAISDERCFIPQRGRDTGHIMHDILDLPSVNPHKSGKWIDYDSLDDTVARLNKEGWGITRYEYKRIQGVLFEMATNCGAKMESEDKE